MSIVNSLLVVLLLRHTAKGVVGNASALLDPPEVNLLGLSLLLLHKITIFAIEDCVRQLYVTMISGSNR